MSLFKKKPDEVKQYVSAGSKARKNWNKFQDTGNLKFKEKAKRSYDEQKALAIKMSNPGTNIENNSFSINHSFNKTKTVKTSVPISIKVKTSPKKK